MSLYPLQRFESNDTVFSYTLNSKPELVSEGRNNDDQRFTLQLIPNANANAKEIYNNNIEIINDLTGNTIADGSAIATTSNQQERRLSISDYRTENGNYYEYEFFGKAEFNEPLFSNNVVEDDGENDVDVNNNNDSDVLMVSDDDLELDERFSFHKQQSLDGLNGVTSTNTLKNLEIHEFIIAPIDNNDDDLEDSFANAPQSKKKVKDYFKLNIFGTNSSSNSNNNSLGPELTSNEVSPSQKMFKNRFFRSRKSTLIKTHSLEQENEVLINSAFESSLSDDNDEDDHAIINPLKLLGNNKEASTQIASKISTNPFKSNNDFEVPEPISDPSDDSKKDLLSVISGSSSPSSPSAPSPSMSSSFSSHSLISRKKAGSTQKTRGRKPSLIPDATKQFGCEFCDRRFKRQEHLKRHVRSLHMCEKPFTCHICNKNFSRSDNLNQHVKTHTSL